MKKITIGLLMAALLPSGVYAQRIQQKMGRAVVAVTAAGDENVLVSWRKLAQEPENCTYNLYRRGQGSTEYTKVNSTPISLTNYQVSKTQVPSGSELAVTMVSPEVLTCASGQIFCIFSITVILS